MNDYSCPKCRGEGNIYIEEEADMAVCLNCHGTGRLPDRRTHKDRRSHEDDITGRRRYFGKPAPLEFIDRRKKYI